MKKTIPLRAKRIDPRSEPTDCPVEALAVEAARLIRAMYSLTDPEFREGPPPTEIQDRRAMFDCEDGPKAHHVRAHLKARLDAIAEFASSRQAISFKGAVFQIYLAANTGAFLTIKFRQHDMQAEDWQIMEMQQERIDGLLYSACDVIDLHGDDDLKFLRSYYYTPHYSVCRLADALFAEMAGE